MGRFVRFDLMSTNVEQSRAFYGELLGWPFGEQGPHTTTTQECERLNRVRAGGHDLGWVVPFDVPGWPAHWIGYLAVDDVEAACIQIEAHGGKICVPPTTLPDGRFAVAEDPCGALFSPFSSSTSQNPPYPASPGGLCWIQLLSRDAERARAFYQHILGWGHTTMAMPGQPPAHLFLEGSFAFASMMEKPKDAAEERDLWLPYFLVSDLEVRTAAAVGLGARIFVPPTHIPGMGGFSVLADPTGASFALWENPK